jgi:hypothetical protein
MRAPNRAAGRFLTYGLPYQPIRWLSRTPSFTHDEMESQPESFLKRKTNLLPLMKTLKNSGDLGGRTRCSCVLQTCPHSRLYWSTFKTVARRRVFRYPQTNRSTLQLVCMRATIEIDDELYRQVKAAAAIRGRKGQGFGCRRPAHRPSLSACGSSHSADPIADRQVKKAGNTAPRQRNDRGNRSATGHGT